MRPIQVNWCLPMGVFESEEELTAPTLMTDRLVLRQLTAARHHNVDWLKDPEVTEYSELRHEKHTLRTCQRYIWSVPWLWGITLLANERHIGNIAATFDIPNRVCDLSILIGDREYWGKGYGSEAWRVVCDWLLSDATSCRKVEAGCMATNLGMRKIMQKTGMLLEGERKLHFIYKGNPVGMLMYGRFR